MNWGLRYAAASGFGAAICGSTLHLHLRQVFIPRELVALIQALIGREFDPALCRQGRLQ